MVDITLTPHQDRDPGRTPLGPPVGYRKGHRRLQAYADAKRLLHRPHVGYGHHHPVRQALHTIGRLLETDHKL